MCTSITVTRKSFMRCLPVLAVQGQRALVAILQESTCLTVMTWNQFVPRLAEFGRRKLPRKWGRVLRRLAGDR